jgi:hypothetical protein
MNTNKDFYIYTRLKGFHNFDKLNDHGKVMYGIFKILHDRKVDYISRINSIKISSQDRSSDPKSAHYHEGKACDIVIDPPEYMPYFAGLIHAMQPFNLYLGTYRQSGTEILKNLHIHNDSYYGTRKNTLFFESTNGQLYSITEKNINDLLKIYKFDLTETVQDFGKFKKDTIKYLLSNLNEADKININKINQTLPEKIIEAKPGEIVDTIKKAGGIIGLTAGTLLVYKLYKFIKR